MKSGQRFMMRRQSIPIINNPATSIDMSNVHRSILFVLIWLYWLAAFTHAADGADILKNVEHLRKIDQAILAAQAFLIKHQSADGAWRSDVYGSFKSGDALTPLVANALGTQKTKGTDYLLSLMSFSGKDERNSIRLTYPLYTAAGTVKLLSTVHMNADQKT